MFCSNISGSDVVALPDLQATFEKLRGVTGDAFRVVYALQLDDDVWVVHAFQKKSTSGIATPKHEIDVVRERIKRLKEALA